MAYPNILTPPMDSPEYLMFSPLSNSRSPTSYNTSVYANQNYSPESNEEEDLGYEARLEILEDPAEKFRFRYKSEMVGTHGSLGGRNSDRSRRQTFPSVRLLNYNGPAIVRCSLYQLERTAPHAHRLVKRSGSEEVIDPHDIEVSEDIGYTANFVNMGIIHTAKKYVSSELVYKLTRLKKEAITREEFLERELTPEEEAEIKRKADIKPGQLNLNQVRLRFEAFKRQGLALVPITAPIYSSTISNLKSALTGDLKIVRMDHCTSSSRGGQEVFILVEKVTKKNIRVRFFELDDDDNEVWNDYGRFSDLDVHHQYAIVFKTPPYRTVDIDKPVKVFIELRRPSDDSRSEPKDFTYTPYEILLGGKRARTSYSSYHSSSISSKDLPTILPNTNIVVNSKDLNEALEKNAVDSTEFQRVCDQLLLGTDPNFQKLYLDDDSELRMDSPLISSAYAKSSCPIQFAEDEIIQRVQREIKGFFTSIRYRLSIPSQQVALMLENLMDDPKYKLDNMNNVIHILILKNLPNHIQFLVALIKLLEKYGLHHILNLPNSAGETPLHLAVKMGNLNLVKILLDSKADTIVQDLQGNTALHFAVMYCSDLPGVLNLLVTHNLKKLSLDMKNNDGNTALHLAVKTNNLEATTSLCTNGADVDLASNTNGYTPLHMAVADQRKTIVMFLLDQECDTTLYDFNECCALKLAKYLIDGEQPVTQEIYEILEGHMRQQGTFNEIYIKEEDVVEISSDMEVENVKVESSTSDGDPLLSKYAKVTYLSEKCTEEISTILNKYGAWTDLADRLDYGHMVRSNVFKGDANPAKSFIDFLMANSENLARIRSALLQMGQHVAVDILDKIVKSEPDD